jgi:hypothetical protein
MGYQTGFFMPRFPDEMGKNGTFRLHAKVSQKSKFRGIIFGKVMKFSYLCTIDLRGVRSPALRRIFAGIKRKI